MLYYCWTNGFIQILYKLVQATTAQYYLAYCTKTLLYQFIMCTKRYTKKLHATISV